MTAGPPHAGRGRIDSKMSQLLRGASVLAWILTVATAVQAQWVPCRHFGVREGLAQSQVTDVTQDASGHLWIATQGGVSRFDGRSFGLFTTGNGLPDNIVTSVTSNGDAVWAATDLGLLARWDGLQFIPVAGPIADRRIPIRSIALERHGELLVATAEGLFRGKPGAFEKLLEPAIDRLRPMPDGSVWALGDRAFRIASGSAPASVELPRLSGHVAGVALEGGTTWIAWTSGNLVRRTPAGYQTIALGLPGMVTDLARDPQGGLLIATDQGVWRRRPGGGLSKIRVTLHEHPLHVRRLFVDRESNVWIGTFGEGLIQRPHSPFTQFTLETGLPATMVWSFSEDPENGCIQMGTGSEGVVSWCGDHWGPTIGPEQGLPSKLVLALGRDDAGRLWIGTRAGVCHLDGGRCTTWTSSNGLPSDDIRGIASDGRGGVWLATARGLAHWNGTEWRSYTSLAGMDSPLLRSVAVDSKGTVWASVHGNGIIAFDGHEARHFGIEDGLPTLRIWTLMADREGTIWASTDEGIWIHPPDGTSSRVIVEGLPTPIVISLLRDDEGMVWAGTTRGLARIAPDGRVTQWFTADDGLTDSEAAEGAAFRDSLGRLWFGMAYGVTRVDSRLLLRNTVPPVAVLERLLVNGTIPEAFRPISSTSSRSGSPWVFGPGAVDLRLDFVAPSLTAPAGVRYRYLLEGFDPSPIGPVAERYVSYHRVPPGRYHFLLEACNNDGVWTARPLTIDLVVLPPWYATLWFRGLLLLFVAGGGFLLIRMRFEAQERRRRILEDQVQRRTAELAEANRRIQEKNELLRELSRTDPLTGLGNRRVLAEHLPLELAVLRREVMRARLPNLDAYHGATLSIVDLDHFKQVNDRWGHEVGDSVLKAVASTLGPVLREGDIAIRWGGEEFVILSRGVDTPGTIQLVRRLLQHIGSASTETPEGTRINLRGSVGFIQLPLGTGDFVENTLWAKFVDAADHLLYMAKERGRFRACGVVWEYGATGPVSEKEILPALIESPDSPPSPLRFVEILPESSGSTKDED